MIIYIFLFFTFKYNVSMVLFYKCLMVYAELKNTTICHLWKRIPKYLAVFCRKYRFDLLVLDQRRMSGLTFASMSGNGPSHVKHLSALQFFPGTLYFVFRWISAYNCQSMMAFKQSMREYKFLLIKPFLIIHVLNAFKIFRKVKIRPFTLMPMSLMRKGGGMM